MRSGYFRLEKGAGNIRFSFRTQFNYASLTVKCLLAILDGFDFNDWQTLDMPDVVDWLKQQRLQQDQQRGILWDSAE